VSIKLLRGGFNRDGFKIASFPYFQDFVTAPTNRQKIEAQKTYDIIHPIIRGYSVDFCYEKQHINPVKIVRYSNYITLETG
jgi:hypothetical protein